MSVYHDRIVGDPEGNKDGTGALDADTHVHKIAFAVDQVRRRKCLWGL